MSIPHARFIQQLQYKAQLAGITVLIDEESYTSAASFLDLDPIPVYKKGEKHRFSGQRIKRAWYKSKNGKLIHADINASLNIITKVVPAAFHFGIEGIAVCPFRVTLRNCGLGYLSIKLLTVTLQRLRKKVGDDRYVISQRCRSNYFKFSTTVGSSTGYRSCRFIDSR
ncbi:zinc ribbon domain-containing protein [Nostoc sp.]|uniref:zinc ribbon domain-containing protein n=1 Tax=Nostoc sp. TaxID=1180 RepID=UPI002FFCD490